MSTITKGFPDAFSPTELIVVIEECARVGRQLLPFEERFELRARAPGLAGSLVRNTI
jgi:hypothetical protein